MRPTVRVQGTTANTKPCCFVAQQAGSRSTSPSYFVLEQMERPCVLKRRHLLLDTNYSEACMPLKMCQQQPTQGSGTLVSLQSRAIYTGPEVLPAYTTFAPVQGTRPNLALQRTQPRMATACTQHAQAAAGIASSVPLLAGDTPLLAAPSIVRFSTNNASLTMVAHPLLGLLGS